MIPDHELKSGWEKPTSVEFEVSLLNDMLCEAADNLRRNALGRFHGRGAYLLFASPFSATLD